MREYPFVTITEEMVATAKKMIRAVDVNRTKASPIDTLTGILGEFAFAQYFYGDWEKNRVGKNKGEVNFKDIEIKASACPFSEKLHLLVREDYALKRKPPFYIQVILDVDSFRVTDIPPGTKAYICGFATFGEVDRAPKKDFGSKYGGKGGYKSHHIPITELHPMSKFNEAYRTLESERNG